MSLTIRGSVSAKIKSGTAIFGFGTADFKNGTAIFGFHNCQFLVSAWNAFCAVLAISPHTSTYFCYNSLGQRTLAVEDMNRNGQIDFESVDRVVSNDTRYVTYNGENRPVRWVRESDNTTIAMSYDHMGRRREKNAQRFFYDGYLQICSYHSPTLNSNCYIWDPTENVATRPLVWQTNNCDYFYAHDGNKNVSEVVDADGSLAAHYEYAPFGEVVAQYGESASENPWRFSSEFAADDLCCVYYNFREYDFVAGRWLTIDPAFEEIAEYIYCYNMSGDSDFLGLYRMISRGSVQKDSYARDAKQILDKINSLNGMVDGSGRKCYDVELKDLEDSSQEAINHASEDAIVFVVGHGTIKDERFYGQSSFSWIGTEEPMVGFLKRDNDFIPLRELKVDAQNMFGCYISPRVRKQSSGGILWWKRYTSSIDDYSVMFKNILKRIDEVAPTRLECCSPMRIVIFEGEFSNVRMRSDKLRAQGSAVVEKRWKK